MKRIIFLLGIFCAVNINLVAQKIEIQNASNYQRNNDLVRAIESANKATTNAETAKDSKAWYLKGTILLKLDDMYSIYLSGKQGIKKNDFEQSLIPFNSTEPGKPLKPETSKKEKRDDGSKVIKATYIYDVVAYFEDNADKKLISISEPTNEQYLKKYDYDLLSPAIEAMNNAINYNTDEESVMQAKLNLNIIALRYFNKAIGYAAGHSYKEATNSFSRSFEIRRDYLGEKDEASFEYANQTNKLYIQELINQHDTVTYIQELKASMDKYPNDVFYYISESNLWLAKKEPNKAINSLTRANELSPGNLQILFAIGVNYAALNDIDKSKDAYLSAIKIDPNYFDAYYNLSALYVDEGNKFLIEANQLPLSEEKQYLELKDKAFALYKIAVPYLEKANNIDSSDMNVLKTLKDIYTKLNELDKIKEINDKIKALSE